MRRRSLLVLVGFLAALCLTAVPARADSELTVMSRNIYLGADVGIALALIPDMPAAAQSMWDQMQATHFEERAPLLAAEFAAKRPAAIGIQEATIWECTSGVLGDRVVVYDFLESLLDETRAAGVEYVIATDGEHPALNPGYSIPPIAGITMVHDPKVFNPLFGTTDAACGFTIGDALLVRADLASDVVASGTVEYAKQTTVVPVLMEITRGYAWADLVIDGSAIRLVTTHLESLWDPGVIPNSAVQAGQLIDDLRSTLMPLIVMGDFNSDPRDPRPHADNPGGQPELSDVCSPAPDPTCSAYRRMVNAGFTDAGPAADDPRNLTWGASGLLAGPDPARIAPAQAMGNPWGLTDRLDYMWLRNGIAPIEAQLIGASWPDAATWDCTTPEQRANAEAAAATLDVAVPNAGACLASDHAGLVVTVAVPSSTATDAALVDRGVNAPNLWAIGAAVVTALTLAVTTAAFVLALLIAGVIGLISRRRGA